MAAGRPRPWDAGTTARAACSRGRHAMIRVQAAIGAALHVLPPDEPLQFAQPVDDSGIHQRRGIRSHVSATAAAADDGGHGACGAVVQRQNIVDRVEQRLHRRGQAGEGCRRARDCAGGAGGPQAAAHRKARYMSPPPPLPRAGLTCGVVLR